MSKVGRESPGPVQSRTRVVWPTPGRAREPLRRAESHRAVQESGGRGGLTMARLSRAEPGKSARKLGEEPRRRRCRTTSGPTQSGHGSPSPLGRLAPSELAPGSRPLARPKESSSRQYSPCRRVGRRRPARMHVRPQPRRRSARVGVWSPRELGTRSDVPTSPWPGVRRTATHAPRAANRRVGQGLSIA
jgi:hypothetical protein